MTVIPHVSKQEHTRYPFFGEMMTCHWIYNANCCSNSTTTELLIQQVSYTFPMTGKAALLTTNFQSRTAVLLQEDNIPPWKLGITKINQGSGRLVKMVTALSNIQLINCVSLLMIIYITPLNCSNYFM